MNWQEKLDKGLNQGINVSKKIIDKAKVKAREISDQSLLAFEIKELEKEEEKLLKDLGAVVFRLLAEGERSSVSMRTGELKPIFERLKEIENLLSEKRSKVVPE